MSARSGHKVFYSGPSDRLSPYPVLAKATEDALRKWKFKPYVRNGKPVKVRTKLPYDFAFKDNVVDTRATADTTGLAQSASSNPSAPSSKGSLDSDRNGVPKRLLVAQRVLGGMIVHKVEPVYPPEAKIRHITGDVILQATIGKDGRVHDLRTISGAPVLVEASIGAVQQWRYRPYILNGEPVEVESTIKVQFRM